MTRPVPFLKRIARRSTSRSYAIILDPGEWPYHQDGVASDAKTGGLDDPEATLHTLQKDLLNQGSGGPKVAPVAPVAERPHPVLSVGLTRTSDGLARTDSWWLSRVGSKTGGGLRRSRRSRSSRRFAQKVRLRRLRTKRVADRGSMYRIHATRVCQAFSFDATTSRPIGPIS